jgi:hypothetical protein
LNYNLWREREERRDYLLLDYRIERKGGKEISDF